MHTHTGKPRPIGVIYQTKRTRSSCNFYLTRTPALPNSRASQAHLALECCGPPAQLRPPLPTAALPPPAPGPAAGCPPPAFACPLRHWLARQSRRGPHVRRGVHMPCTAAHIHAGPSVFCNKHAPAHHILGEAITTRGGSEPPRMRAHPKAPHASTPAWGSPSPLLPASPVHTLCVYLQ